MGTTDDFFPSYSVVDRSINFWELHHLGFTISSRFAVSPLPISPLVSAFLNNPQKVIAYDWDEAVRSWRFDLAFLSSDSEKLWAAGCVRFIYRKMELCYAGNVVRCKTRINSLNKKCSLFLAKRVIVRLCAFACYFDEELNYRSWQIPMFSLGYLARLKWNARGSFDKSWSFISTSRRCLRHFNSCSHCSQNMGILSMLLLWRIN